MAEKLIQHKRRFGNCNTLLQKSNWHILCLQANAFSKRRKNRFRANVTVAYTKINFAQRSRVSKSFESFKMFGLVLLHVQ